MWWRAHGRRYAIGKHIHHALQRGLTVVTEIRNDGDLALAGASFLAYLGSGDQG